MSVLIQEAKVNMLLFSAEVLIHSLQLELSPENENGSIEALKSILLINPAMFKKKKKFVVKTTMI